MKKYLKIVFTSIIVIVILSLVFCKIDSLRVYDGKEPIFTLSESIVDGIDYSAKVNTGLGYKIARYTAPNQPDMIKIGTFFMKVASPYELGVDSDSGDKEPINTEVITISSGELQSGESGDSGEKEVKITTFGEKYTDVVMIEGQEQDINIKRINSKLGYSMNYYYELFDYSGFDDHDKYIWNQISGDSSNYIVINSLSGEKEFNETVEKIEKDKDFNEVSGEEVFTIQKAYFKAYTEKDVRKVTYIYIISLNDLKFRVEFTILQEAEEGIGTYMRKMIYSISL